MNDYSALERGFRREFEENLIIRKNALKIVENCYEAKNIIYIWSNFETIFKKEELLKKKLNIKQE
jgi:hypothetical protein